MHKFGAVVLVAAVLLFAACSGDGSSGAIRTAVGDQEAPPEQEAPPVQEEPPEQEEPPVQEEPPEQEEPVAEPPVAVVDDGGDGVPTALIILGAVLLVFLLLLAGWWRGRVRSSATEHSSWRDKAFASYAMGAAVHDAIAVQLTGSSSQTGFGHQDLEQRMSELTVNLHALEIDPPNAETAGAVQEVLGTLTTLRSAVQVNFSMPGDDQSDERRAAAAALVRRRLAEFDESLSALKAAV